MVRSSQEIKFTTLLLHHKATASQVSSLLKRSLVLSVIQSRNPRVCKASKSCLHESQGNRRRYRQSKLKKEHLIKIQSSYLRGQASSVETLTTCTVAPCRSYSHLYLQLQETEMRHKNHHGKLLRLQLLSPAPSNKQILTTTTKTLKYHLLP